MSLFTSMGLLFLFSQSPDEWALCDKALLQASATKQVEPVLRTISKACAKATPALAEAAGRAVDSGFEKRSALLLEEARPLLPETCKVKGALEKASEVAPECPTLEVSDALKSNLDAGTYLFILALHREREKVGPVSETFQSAVRWFLLAAALENERYKP